MPDRFKADIFGQLTDRSPTVWTTDGDSISIDGVPHIRLAGGLIVPDDRSRWSLTSGEAKHRAADELDEIAARITTKAASLRTEADATANTGSPS
jgi:hypothetical protein